ncbi:hypothetical protein OPW41_12260 [Vibrio europaeus]|uniref:Uncharacterized protein n=1 Tax=Vibrio europaeus TaxID=300876 RepID=A0A178J584_9VIBR|nr:hypothetical protein [Vibrio europaeus]MDC5706577.1 hypothetical protein [Vibrio europaeus]MDC5711890.1 hypothetical protein [Vibrio europaeus]MDC5716417.1 hypothetical protein [Vibrio europaeus]MDC5721872.1 hypothetical protein [Vibrio europaeus]MDC5725988.1 hypothetical protein [Vibrio europaeus]
MTSVDKWLKRLALMVTMTALVNAGLKYRDVPPFMKGANTHLYYSNNVNVKMNGDVTFYEDYHTLFYRLFFNKRSFSSRSIYGEDRDLYFSYYADFYSNNLMLFSDFSMPEGLVAENNYIEVEAHALRRLSNEVIQVIYSNARVLCYTKLLEGGVKCMLRRKA